MPIVREELWTRVPLPAMYVVTTNSFIRRDGALVMGRGAALQATKLIPGIEYECGQVVEEMCGHLGQYGFAVVREPTRTKAGFGIFQVKYHWKESALLPLIDSAVTGLIAWWARFWDLPIRMNYPGIGNGGLNRAEVEPLLEPLPDCVTICYR